MLPNGVRTQATHYGTIALSSLFTLKNVLFVPHLQCHLISVGSLIDDLKCIVAFSADSCLIQDCTSNSVLGTGCRSGGVYFLGGDRMLSAQAQAVISKSDDGP